MKPVKCSLKILNHKRAYYLRAMQELDADNNEIIAQIERMEKTLGKLRAQLNKGRQKREVAKRRISRYKQMIKNKNRDDNSEII